jgi:hypothetical protein
MPATKIRTPLKAAGLVWDEFFKAGVDMSNACALYHWVQPGSIFGEVVPATGASNPYPLGILYNQPAPQANARVRVMGKALMATCMGASPLNNGGWVTAGSGGLGSTPAACMANARYAGSGLASGLVALQYAEVYLLGPSFNTCISTAS